MHKFYLQINRCQNNPTIDISKVYPVYPVFPVCPGCPVPYPHPDDPGELGRRLPHPPDRGSNVPEPAGMILVYVPARITCQSHLERREPYLRQL